MKGLGRMLFLCVFGGLAYTSLEILWRGYTHWTMALTGGACFTALGNVGEKMKGKSLTKRCFAGASIITGLEFVVGCIVNIQFHLHVWDYSKELINLKGQICAKYWTLWFLLSAPTMFLAQKMNECLKKPKESIAVAHKFVYNYKD